MTKVKNILLTSAVFLLQSLFIFGQNPEIKTENDIVLGIERLAEFGHKLEGKRIGAVTNHTGTVGGVHLVDLLINAGLDVKKVFAPEHGFRGTGDAGEYISSGKDIKTGLPVISLYGKNKKPRPEHLHDIDLLIFDIQDVGVRYYTYISTLHYVMEAAAEADVEVWVPDRPNPNGFYVSGPVLTDEKYRSFVGMHPIPLVHGLTVGELAKMINGEGWLNGGVECSLKILKMKNYDHNDLYQLPVDPSPNLRSMNAVYFYPGLGLFEGTEISVGRGTDFPFEVFGHPDLSTGDFYFTPQPGAGAKHPKLNGEKCRGFDLRGLNPDFMFETKELYLNWLKVAYDNYNGSKSFFKENGFFELLAGTDALRKQIEQRVPLKEIKKSWEPELKQYMEIRAKYLLYPDFQN